MGYLNRLGKLRMDGQSEKSHAMGGAISSEGFLERVNVHV